MTTQPAMTVELLPFADQMPAMRAAMAKALPDISQDILHHALLAALRAITLSPPDGWKLVPMESTDDMQIAFAEVWYTKVRCVDDCEMQDCYKAMLAASPEPPK